MSVTLSFTRNNKIHLHRLSKSEKTRALESETTQDTGDVRFLELGRDTMGGGRPLPVREATTSQQLCSRPLPVREATTCEGGHYEPAALQSAPTCEGGHYL